MNCSHCNKPFSRVVKGKKYCSQQCQNRAKSKRARFRRITTKDLRYRYICEYCKRPFFYYDKKKRGQKVYCSQKCSQLARRKYLSVAQCLEESNRKLDKNLGYVRVYSPMHKEANTWGYVYEHRLIAEVKIGRPLVEDEVVHHINGIRWDNRPSNLEVMDKKQHSAIKK